MSFSQYYFKVNLAIFVATLLWSYILREVEANCWEWKPSLLEYLGEERERKKSFLRNSYDCVYISPEWFALTSSFFYKLERQQLQPWMSVYAASRGIMDYFKENSKIFSLPLFAAFSLLVTNLLNATVKAAGKAFASLICQQEERTCIYVPCLLTCNAFFCTLYHRRFFNFFFREKAVLLFLAKILKL